MKRNAVFAIFSEENDINRTFRALRAAGFGSNDISLLTPEEPGVKDFHQDQPTRVAQGAEFGGGLGLMLGGSAGLLAGLQVMSLPFAGAEPALSPFVAALLGAVFGGLLGAGSGALVGIGTPSCAAVRYAHYLKDGGILLSVHVEDPVRMQQVMRIMDENGGSDPAMVNESAAWRMIFSHERPVRMPVNAAHA